jgi:hypothetical protein
VDTEVRRSERLKEINKGFKSSSCPSKNCLCCKTAPPTLSSKVIRSLGKDLCNIPLEDLSEEVFKKKPVEKKGKSVNLIQPKADKPSTNLNNDDKSKKKRAEMNGCCGSKLLKRLIIILIYYMLCYLVVILLLSSAWTILFI